MAFNTDNASTSMTQKSAAPQFAVGTVTFDGSITTADSYLANVGFTPRYVKFMNITDQIAVEWVEGMTANNCLKSAAAGTNTTETTNGGITICDADGTANTAGNSFSVLQNATLAVIAASKVCYWVAYG